MITDNTTFKVVIWLWIVISAGCPAEGGDAEKRSPDGRIGVLVDDNSGEPYFFDFRKSRKCGFVLPASQRGEINKLSWLSNWLPDSSVVAILLYYGGRMNEILVFKRDDEGNMKGIKFNLPDLSKMYKSEGINVEGVSGFEQNSLGPWINNTTIRLLAGRGKEFPDGVRHFVVKVLLRVDAGVGVVEQVKQRNVMSDEVSRKFFEQWGEQYWRRNQRP
jgi:hypothetical protein